MEKRNTEKAGKDVDMGIALSSLIERIGVSVQHANAMIEQTAVAAYLGQGYEVKKEDGKGEEYIPVSYALRIPTAEGEKQVNVPVTALMHHNSLKLEQVDIKLKFLIEEGDGEDLVVSVKPLEDVKDSFSMSELSLQFKSAPPAEGTARVNNRHVQTL